MVQCGTRRNLFPTAVDSQLKGLNGAASQTSDAGVGSPASGSQFWRGCRREFEKCWRSCTLYGHAGIPLRSWSAKKPKALKNQCAQLVGRAGRRLMRIPYASSGCYRFFKQAGCACDVGGSACAKRATCHCRRFGKVTNSSFEL